MFYGENYPLFKRKDIISGIPKEIAERQVNFKNAKPINKNDILNLKIDLHFFK